MTPFNLYIECAHCGGDLDWVTGTPNPADKTKREDVTVLRCRRNGHHLWVVRVELLKAPVDARVADRQRHEGTSTGWRERKAERLRRQGVGHSQEPGRRVAS